MFEGSERLSRSPDDTRRNPDHRTTLRYGMDDHRSRSDLYVVSELDVSQDGGARSNHHPIANRRMPFTPLVAGTAQRDALIQQNVVAHFGRFTNYHAGSVIDEKALADLSARMNLNACYDSRALRYESRHNVAFVPVEPVRNAVEQDRMQAGIAKQDFETALGGWVFSFDRLDVFAKRHLAYCPLMGDAVAGQQDATSLDDVSTDRLYYTDCYLSVFEARVIETAEDGRRVYLDRTAFYPSSGGQPNDLGTLGDVAVLDVVDEQDRIAHVVAAPPDTDSVRGEVDWLRRYDHMQQHTGQHLLSAVLVELFAYQTLSFHMGAEMSTVELTAKELTDTQMEAAEQRANQIVREARRVNICFEEASAVEGLRKASARTGTLRVIDIEGVDRSACGGTHVRSTAEVGPIQIRKSEKIRGNVRIEFVCGTRVLRRAKQDFRILTELSRHCAVAFDRLPEHIAALRQRLQQAEKERQRIAIELARCEGKALHQAASPSKDGLRRLSLRVPAINEVARAKAQAFTACGAALALIVAADVPGVLIAASGDSGINAGAILKEVLARAGGRGGGSATLAQGSLPNHAVEHSLAAALGFALPDLADDPDSQKNKAAGEKSSTQAERQLPAR